MKKFIVFCVLCLSVITAVNPLFICRTYADNGHVFDYYGLLTNSESKDLEEYLSGVSAECGYCIVVVTVSSYPDASMKSFCERFYGDKLSGLNAVILAVSMDEREYYVYSCGELAALFNGSEIDGYFLKKLSKGSYFESFKGFGMGCKKILAGADGSSDNTGSISQFAENYSYELRQACLVGGIMGLFLAVIRTVAMVCKLKSVRPSNNASDYVSPGSFFVRSRNDRFTHSNITRTIRSNDNGSRGGSHGGSSGGHGGHF